MTKREFSFLVERYQALVFTVCRQIVSDAEEAKDLTQATFLSAWQHADSCPAGFERQWLIRIAANKAKDHLKSAKRREIPSDFEGQEFFMGKSPPTEDEVISQMAAEDLREIILSLDEPYLKVSERFFLRNESIGQIALELKRPQKTVYSQLSRAKAILKKRIERSAQI